MDVKEENYISQLLSGGKSFGETTARKIEKAAKKPKYWMDTDEDVPAPRELWPFDFDKALWDRLTPTQKRDAEKSLLTHILGTSILEASAPAKRRKPM